MSLWIFTQRYLLCANHGALFRVFEDGFVLEVMSWSVLSDHATAN